MASDFIAKSKGAEKLALIEQYEFTEKSGTIVFQNLGRAVSVKSSLAFFQPCGCVASLFGLALPRELLPTRRNHRCADYSEKVRADLSLQFHCTLHRLQSARVQGGLQHSIHNVRRVCFSL